MALSPFADEFLKISADSTAARRPRASVESAVLPGLGKEATSHGVAGVLKSRSGRKPISISKLIERHRSGTLYKRKLSEAGAGALVPVLTGKQSGDPDAFTPRPGRIPSRDDGEQADAAGFKREDGRSSAQTFPAERKVLNDIFPLQNEERTS